jgi:predicted nucleic acid-binding Zn ribbon protein
MATNKRRPRATPRGGSSPAAIREEILREWRGAEEVSDPNAGIHRADQFIAAILRSAGIQDGIHEDELRAAWKELAGDFIARHTEPASVKGGHLVLRVTQPAMRFHLEQMKPMLLTRIREQLGENRIQSVKFTLG